MSRGGGPRTAPGGAPPQTGVFVVLVTGPDVESLRSLARTVVGERLAACVNVVPALTSVYRWREEVVEEVEALAILKTTGERLSALEDRVREIHPYELPEFVALPVSAGSRPYLEWVAAEAREEDEIGSEREQAPGER